MLLHRRNGQDDYQTPPEAIAPLLPYLRRDWRIWECAAGKGYLAGALRRAGHQVVATDLIGGVDFLRSTRRCEAIVTNPPFSVKDQFLRRCYELGKPFALLLPITALEGRKRQEMFRSHGLELLLLDRRVNYETPRGEQGQVYFASAWFTWGLHLGAAVAYGKMPHAA